MQKWKATQREKALPTQRLEYLDDLAWFPMPGDHDGCVSSTAPAAARRPLILWNANATANQSPANSPPLQKRMLKNHYKPSYHGLQRTSSRRSGERVLEIGRALV